MDDTLSRGHKKSMPQLQTSISNPCQHIQLGEHLFNRGDLGGALDQFLKALDINKNSGDAHNNLGVCYWNLKDYSKALNHFSKALENDRNTRIIENCNQIFKSIDKISSQGEWAMAYKIFYLMSVKNQFSRI